MTKFYNWIVCFFLISLWFRFVSSTFSTFFLAFIAVIYFQKRFDFSTSHSLLCLLLTYTHKLCSIRVRCVCVCGGIFLLLPDFIIFRFHLSLCFLIRSPRSNAKSMPGNQKTSQNENVFSVFAENKSKVMQLMRNQKFDVLSGEMLKE